MISMSIIEVGKEDDPTPSLECMPYIHHLVHFKKDEVKIQSLLDSSSEFNIMTPAFASRLGFKVQSTDIRA